MSSAGTISLSDHPFNGRLWSSSGYTGASQGHAVRVQTPAPPFTSREVPAQFLKIGVSHFLLPCSRHDLRACAPGESPPLYESHTEHSWPQMCGFVGILSTLVPFRSLVETMWNPGIGPLSLSCPFRSGPSPVTELGQRRSPCLPYLTIRKLRAPEPGGCRQGQSAVTAGDCHIPGTAMTRKLLLWPLDPDQG